MYAGPLLAGCLNLALLIHARSRVKKDDIWSRSGRTAFRSLTFRSTQPCGPSCSGPIPSGRRSDSRQRAEGLP